MAEAAQAEVWNDRPVDLTEYFWTLLRRRRVVAYSAGTLFFLTLLYNLFAARVYEARTTVQVGKERPLTFFGELEVLQPRGDPVLSEVEIVKSRTVAEGAVRRAGLQFRTIKGWGDLAVRFEYPWAQGGKAPAGGTYTLLRCECPPEFEARGNELNPALEREGDADGSPHAAAPPSSLRCYEIRDRKGSSVGYGAFGRVFRNKGLMFVAYETDPDVGRRVSFEVLEFDGVVRDLRERTAVVTKRNTDIIEIVVRARSPEDAARSANALAVSYIQSTVDRQARQAKSTAEFIGQQIKNVSDGLRAAEEALRVYKEEHGIVTLSETTKGMLDTWTEEESHRARIQAQLEQARAIHEVLKAPPDPTKPVLISTGGIDNPVLADLASRLTGLELRRVQLSQGLSPRHSAMLELDAQISEARRKLTEELEATINSLGKALAAADTVLAGFDARMRRLPEAEYELAKRLRDSKVKEELYTLLLQKRQEAQISQQAEIGTAWQVDPAIEDPRPVHPKVFRNLFRSVLLGLLLGIGIAFLLERLDRSLRSASDVERAVGLPTFGLIPEIPARISQAGRLVPGDGERASSSGQKLITQVGLQGVVAEAYRSLRTNVQFAFPGVESPGILVTSPGPGEGKSLTSANLAVVLGNLGRKVVVVDGDLRRPIQHRIFGLDRRAGLSEILAGTASWRDAVQTTGLENVDLLSAGHLPPNPAELLSQGTLGALIRDLRSAYDVVLIDSPPVLPFTDASVIAASVSGAFLIARAGATDPQALLRARSMLEGVGARVVGVILNRVSPDHGLGLPGYYRYYHQYDGGDSELAATPAWVASLPRDLRRLARRSIRTARARACDLAAIARWARPSRLFARGKGGEHSRLAADGGDGSSSESGEAARP